MREGSAGFSEFENRIDGLIQLPDNVSMMQDIPVETMIKRGALSPKHAANVRANVKKIKLLYNITPEKSRKKAMRSGLTDYDEIQIIALNLVSHSFYKYGFYHFLQPIFHAIPYPMIVVAYCVNAAEPVMRIAADICRDNKLDDSLNVVEAVKSTCWIGMNSLNDIQGCNSQLLRSFPETFRNASSLEEIYNTWLSEIILHDTTFRADRSLNQNEFSYFVSALEYYERIMERKRESW